MQKTIYRSLVFSFLFVGSCIFGFGQGCPSIEIVTPAGQTRSDDLFTVNALIKSKSGVGSLKYDWTVSGGTIESGQGTAVISVRTTLEHAGETIKVTVTISGISSVCENTASEVVAIAPANFDIRTADQFGVLGANEVKAIIDNIFIELDSDPNLFALFEMEFTDSETVQDRTLRITRILDAIKFRRYDLNKVMFLISNKKESTYTTVKILPLSMDITDYINRGDLIYGRDIKHRLSTLFQNK